MEFVAPVDQGDELASVAPRWHHTAVDAPTIPPPSVGPRPLDGIKVLDLTRVLAGPFATRILSDLGAEVVKVEPPEGDLSRAWGTVIGGQSGFFVQQNVGKRALCVNLRAEGGPELIQRLATHADIVIENFRPGIMDRFGLGYDELRQRNPALIMLSISGFGQRGPGRDRPAYASIVQAEMGLVERQATADGAAPTDPVLSIADTYAGLHGLVGVLAALHLRSQTGVGQHIDMAMLNSMTFTDDYAHHAMDESELVRLGGTLWETGFGSIVVAGTQQTLWADLARVGRVNDGLTRDVDLPTKIRVRGEILRDTLAQVNSTEELEALLDGSNTVWGRVKPFGEIFEEDVATERRVFTSVDNRAGGQRRVMEAPYHFSHAQAGARGPAPHRGEHNAEILRDWLGFDTQQIAVLAEQGVICRDDAAIAASESHREETGGANASSHAEGRS